MSAAVTVSRLPVGSSPTISLGSAARDRAMATRCGYGVAAKVAG